MAVRGDAADLVRQAGAGMSCEPEDPESSGSWAVVIKKKKSNVRDICRERSDDYKLCFRQTFTGYLRVSRLMAIDYNVISDCQCIHNLQHRRRIQIIGIPSWKNK